jgi:hypothetical protein
MRHQEFFNNETGWYYFTKKDPDPVWSELRSRIRNRSKTRPDPQHSLKDGIFLKIGTFTYISIIWSGNIEFPSQSYKVIKIKTNVFSFLCIFPDS